MPIQGARQLRARSAEENGHLSGAGLDLSVVIPLFNEELNVEPLLDELFGVLRQLGRTYEVIAVDDGSRDGTFAALLQAAAREPALRIIRLRRNYGQTAAMSAGIEAARGDVIVPLDGDLQNDPADIGPLLARLEGGDDGEPFDVVSGWRRDRNDEQFGRKLPSQVANWLISALSGVWLHDYGCSIKAYRREVLEGVRLYGEMHRFIPIYATWQGARVTEMVVNHRPRRAGASHYGFARIGKVLLDLLVVKFLSSFATKPIYLFGGFGLVSLLAGCGTFAWAVAYKLTGVKDFVETPLPLLTVLFGLVAVLSILLGLLAELVIRTYYESQDKRPYLVSEQINPTELDALGNGRGMLDEEQTSLPGAGVS
jgi:glycosyltransferase involved in cell wall biosynthesis